MYAFAVRKRISSLCCDSSPLHTTPASFLTLSSTAAPIILFPHLVCLPLSPALWSPGIRVFIYPRPTPFSNSITLRPSLPLFSLQLIILKSLCACAIFPSYMQVRRAPQTCCRHRSSVQYFIIMSAIRIYLHSKLLKAEAHIYIYNIRDIKLIVCLIRAEKGLV